MSEKKCIDCTMDIPAKAKRCPHCTSEQPRPKNSSVSATMLFLGAVAAVMTVLCFGQAMNKPNKPGKVAMDGAWMRREIAGATILQQWAKGHPRGAKETPVASVACKDTGGYLGTVSTLESSRELTTEEMAAIMDGQAVSLIVGDGEYSFTGTPSLAAIRFCQ